MTTKEQTKGTQGSTLFQNRLTAYSTLAVAGASAVAVTPKAKADIVYSGPLNLSVPVSTAGIYINLSTFATYTSLTTAQAADATAPIVNIWGTTNTYSYLYPTTSTVNRFVSTGANPLELPAASIVDANATYGTTRAPGALTTNLWTAGTTGYLGIRFLNGATTDYGWLQLSAQAPPTTANPTKILGIAYDNTGAGIATGQTAVPEPGTVGFLAAGAMGAAGMAWRRRKMAA